MSWSQESSSQPSMNFGNGGSGGGGEPVIAPPPGRSNRELPRTGSVQNLVQKINKMALASSVASPVVTTANRKSFSSSGGNTANFGTPKGSSVPRKSSSSSTTARTNNENASWPQQVTTTSPPPAPPPPPPQQVPPPVYMMNPTPTHHQGMPQHMMNMAPPPPTNDNNYIYSMSPPDATMNNGMSPQYQQQQQQIQHNTNGFMNHPAATNYTSHHYHHPAPPPPPPPPNNMNAYVSPGSINSSLQYSTNTNMSGITGLQQQQPQVAGGGGGGVPQYITTTPNSSSPAAADPSGPYGTATTTASPSNNYHTSMNSAAPMNSPPPVQYNNNNNSDPASQMPNNNNNNGSNISKPSTVRRSSTQGSHPCSKCGVNVQLAYDQMEMARQKLELLQEKVEVDQELLKQEKRNFKRRLQAAKLAVTKSQQAAAAKERQRQLEWNKVHTEHDEATKQKLRAQQNEYERKLAQAEMTASEVQKRHNIEIQSLQGQLMSMQEEVDVVVAARDKERAALTVLQEKMHEAVPSAEQQNRIDQLERDLEDKQMEMESLEMQLLELERERETGGLRGSGGTTTSGSGELCKQCQAFDRQLADAQLQLDTLQNRQAVTDQKLSAERRKYEDLRHKWEAAEAERLAQHEDNDQCIRMAKEMLDLQQQLKDARLREQESASMRKTVEQKMIALQEENESLQEKLEELQQSNENLEKEMKEEKEKAELALATAAATQRAVQDSAVAPVDVLSATAAPPAVLAASDPNRKLVMEYEWHGPEFMGVYTGQLSVTTNNPDGNGTLRLDDGAVYDGEWVNGKPHGSGVWATIEGDLHNCTGWNGGNKHGTTVDVWSDGRVYRGTYQHGKRHGYGVLTWPYGAYYEGQFADDKRNGEGRYCYADGRCYTGTYKDDRPHGYGIMKAEDGTIIYDGFWQLGEFIGNQRKDDEQ